MRNRRTRKKRRLALLVAVTGGVLGAVLVIPAAAFESGATHLDARVVVSQNGPIGSCADLQACSEDNIVRYFIYVRNLHAITTPGPTGFFRARTTFPDAFVISSVEQRVMIDGVEASGFTFTPPPYPTYRPFSGHWPSTVTCPAGSDPCNVVEAPAVLPGENELLFYTGWVHGADEPNGSYVFAFTIHGTVDGSPVEVEASSPPISMHD